MIHILHLEDSPADAELVEAKLDDAGLDCRITLVDKRNDFEQALMQHPLDIILADYRLPGYDGMTALGQARKLRSDIPFIFVSGTMGEEAAIDALTCGATDYVLKHNLSRLSPAVQRALNDARIQSDRKQAEQQIKLLSHALNHVREGAFLTDLHDTVVYVNQEACRSLGYERNELLGMRVLDFDPDMTDKELAEIKIAAQEASITFETRHQTRSGRIFPVEITATQIDFDGDQYGLSLVRDITERKNIERQRRLAENGIRQNLAQQKALLHMYQDLDTAPIPDLISFVVDQCVGLTESAIGFVGLISDDDLNIEARIWSEKVMENCPLNDPLVFPIRKAGMWAEPIRQQQPIIVNDYQAPNPQKKGYPEGHLELSRFMGIPVIDQGRVVAVASIANRGEPYTESDQDKVSLLLQGMWDLIKRKRAEELSQKTMQNLEEAQRLARIGSWELDLKTNGLTWSDEIYRIFEIDPSQFGGTYEAFLELVHPEDREMVDNGYRNSLTTKTPFAIDHRLNVSGGRVKYVHEQCETFYEQDTPVKSIGTVQDITERREAEKRLSESERRYRSLIENYPEFIARFGTDLRYRYVNPAVTRAFDLSLKDIVGKKLSELPIAGPPKQNELIERKVREVIETEKSNNMEAEWSTAEGERNFEIVHIPEKDEKGSIVSVLGIGRDITDRKLAELERTSHLDFFRNMDRINLAIQRAYDLDQMMIDTLDIVLSIFDCDRANLMYPCDPDADTFSVRMERCKPGYPGALSQGAKIPITPEQAETMRILLDTDGPVQSGPGCPYEIPRDILDHYNIKSFMSMAIYPKTGKPWRFTLHQCAHTRDWTTEETRLFEAIGRRLADALSSLLSQRELRESEKFLDKVVEHIPDMIFVKEAQTLSFVRFNKAGEELLGLPRKDLLGKNDHDFFPREEADFFTEKDRQVLESKKSVDIPLKKPTSWPSRPKALAVLKTDPPTKGWKDDPPSVVSRGSMSIRASPAHKIILSLPRWSLSRM
jgi:PAS domain S-box-containing protein